GEEAPVRVAQQQGRRRRHEAHARREEHGHADREERSARRARTAHGPPDGREAERESAHAGRRGLGRAADAAREFDRSPRSGRALDGPPDVLAGATSTRAPAEFPRTLPSYIISACAAGWTKRPPVAARVRK